MTSTVPIPQPRRDEMLLSACTRLRNETIKSMGSPHWTWGTSSWLVYHIPAKLAPVGNLHRKSCPFEDPNALLSLYARRQARVKLFRIGEVHSHHAQKVSHHRRPSSLWMTSWRGLVLVAMTVDLTRRCMYLRQYGSTSPFLASEPSSSPRYVCFCCRTTRR